MEAKIAHGTYIWEKVEVSEILNSKIEKETDIQKRGEGKNRGEKKVIKGIIFKGRTEELG